MKIFPGELEAIEEEAGTVVINLVGGEAMDDLKERVLERGLIVRQKDGESSAGVTGDGRLALRMVEVAVGFSAQSG